MKANSLIVFAVFFFSMGCKKEVIKIPIFYPGKMTYGRMDAKKGGEDWVASSAAFNYDTIPSFFGISSATFSEEDFLREELIFNKIPKTTGKYVISGPINNIFDGFVGSTYHTSEDDGDASEDNWDVDETATDNYIEVTMIDTVANIVQGNFTVSFNIATSGGKRNPDNPDKVKFSKGTFDVTFFK